LFITCIDQVFRCVLAFGAIFWEQNHDS
jgi:hypothetical protein